VIFVFDLSRAEIVKILCGLCACVCVCVRAFMSSVVEDSECERMWQRFSKLKNMLFELSRNMFLNKILNKFLDIIVAMQSKKWIWSLGTFWEVWSPASRHYDRKFSRQRVSIVSTANRLSADTNLEEDEERTETFKKRKANWWRNAISNTCFLSNWIFCCINLEEFQKYAWNIFRF
jgi:hypothetical protein